MPFIIRRDIFLSFLSLIFLPLVIMAGFSITVFNKIEEYNTNNLEANLNAIKIAYNNSAGELENSIIQKSNQISLASDLNTIKSGNIDILLIVDPSKIKDFGNLEAVLRAASKEPVSSTEIIPENIIKNHYKNDINKLIINPNLSKKHIWAGLANISASKIKNSNKILVGIKFIKLNSKLHKEISNIIRGKLLFIQKDYIITEISREFSDKQSKEEDEISYNGNLNTSNVGTLTKMLHLFKKNHIYTISPIYSYNKAPIGAIFLVKSMDDINNLKKQNTTLIIITILTIGAIISAVTYHASRKLIIALNEITEVARAVRYGDLSKRVKPQKNTQMAQLSLNINKMIESLEDRENIIREYQREIHEQKEYLESLINSFVDGVITISKNCKITKINPIITIWSGLKEEEIIEKRLADFLGCNCSINCTKIKENISEICPLILQNERLAPTEAKIMNNQTGTEKLLSLNFSHVLGVNDEPSYVIVLRDITEFKEMEKMKEDFMATLTHDLRVPILAEATTIKFFLRGSFGAYTDKQKEAMENMLDSTNGMLSLVNSLLDTYKFESGQDELSKELVNIRKLAQDCVAELTPIAKKNDQILTNLISKEIPILKADKKEIKRVLMNLISNALTYTPKSGLINIDAEKRDDEILIKVIDTGKGIPESELEVIFDRFFSKAKKFRKIGTGLGLYLSKKIIEKHNGKIWAESQIGKGSTFIFSLPLDN